MSKRTSRHINRPTEGEEGKQETSEESQIAEEISESWDLGGASSTEAANNEPTAHIEEEAEYSANESSSESEHSEDNMSEQTPPTSVVVDGETLQFASKPNPEVQEFQPLYPKRSRYTMTSADLNSLYKEMQKKTLGDLFQQTSSMITDADAVADTVVIKDQIARVVSHMREYDMVDSFSIIEPEPDDPYTVKSSKDLLTHYSTIPLKAVAASNKWKRRYLNVALQPWIPDNMSITFRYLANNTEESLYSKIMETYETYSPDEQGGALYFALMMNVLQKNLEEQCASLNAALRRMKLTDFEGENVPKAVTCLRAIIQRLEEASTVFTTDGQEIHKYIPTNIKDIILQFFQTSSVQEFNMRFQILSTFQTMADSDEGVATTEQPELVAVKDILKIAETEYTKLLSTGKWTGVSTPGKSSFNASSGKPRKMRCWNCGEEGHGISDCPKPTNQPMIDRNKKAFREAKAKDRGGKKGGKARGGGGGGGDKGIPVSPTGRFNPPSHSEKGRRWIDGVLYKYSKSKKMWYKQKAEPAPAGAPAAQVAVPQADLSVQTPTTTTSTLTPPTPPVPPTSANVAGASNDASRAHALRAAANVRAREAVTVITSQLDAMDNLH